jgi:ribA/ribD-fused uncharacterized protein
MINVVNKSKHKPTENDFYIGRGSVMGNPYHTKESNHPQALYKVETTEEAIIGFESHLRDAILSGDPHICDFINNIIIKYKKDEDINLVCFCSPDPCHGHTIKNFVEEQRNCINWFSNMRRFDESLVYQDIHYWTPENFYVAMKVPNNKIRQAERQKIAQMNPQKAKVYGRTLTLREDWDEVKVDIMRVAVGHKFKEGTSWQKKLLEFNKPIVEWNNWKDKFWGKCIFTGEGENMLGKLIEEQRTVVWK